MKTKKTPRVTLREIKTTLDELTEAMGFVVKHMATKEELQELDVKLTEGLSSLRIELKGDIFALHTQVNSIEADIREMKREMLHLH